MYVNTNLYEQFLYKRVRWKNACLYMSASALYIVHIHERYVICPKTTRSWPSWDIRTCLNMYVYVYVCMHIHVHTYIYVYIHTYMHICKVYMYVCTYMYIYMIFKNIAKSDTTRRPTFFQINLYAHHTCVNTRVCHIYTCICDTCLDTLVCHIHAHEKLGFTSGLCAYIDCAHVF